MGSQKVVYNDERQYVKEKDREEERERESEQENDSSFETAVLLFHMSTDTYVSLSLGKKKEVVVKKKVTSSDYDRFL